MIYELQLLPSYCIKLGAGRLLNASLLLTTWLPLLTIPKGTSVIELHDTALLAIFSTVCSLVLVFNGILAVTRCQLFTDGHEVVNTVAIATHMGGWNAPRF